ncbi:MAG: glycosyltransferase [bacterium]|nr:glycosyltransferase [bacterium]
MPSHPTIDVVIPAHDEAGSVGSVLADLPRERLRDVVVVDNASTDGTADVARAAGATVVAEARRGYGSACLAGLARVGAATPPPDVVVFLDADYSDHPDELPRVVQPILDDRADVVVGSRVLGDADPGALLLQARFGNWLAARLIRALYGLRVSDLGPFRAVRWDALQRLGMVDTNFGWTVEMQVKAAKLGLRYAEVPVSYRRRIGVSKITGTLRGTIGASWKILYTIFRYAFSSSSRS